MYTLHNGIYWKIKKLRYLKQHFLSLDNNRNTVLLAVFACFLWSSVYSTIKIGLQYDTPLHFAGLRFILTGLILLPFTGSPVNLIKTIRDNAEIILWVLVLQILANYILFYIGLNLVPGALGAVIVGSQPLFTAVLASLIMQEEQLTRKKVFIIIAGISGVVLISAGRQAFRLGGLAELLGVIFIIGANIATAASNVMISLKGRNINPTILNAVTMFSGGLILYFLSFVFEVRIQDDPPPKYWIVMVWLTLVSAAAFSIWYNLLQRPGIKVSELNLWKFIIPGAGAILSWLLVPGEKPEWLTITGIIIITASLIGFYLSTKPFLKR